MQDHGLGQAITVAGDLPCGPAGMGDRQLLEDAEAWEALGRLVDARRVAIAGEVAWRSREQLGEHGLARRQGDRDATDLLARELLISGREARKRTALGLRVRSRLSMQGEELPGRWAHVAAALAAGTISVDAARVIVDALGSIARRADAEELEIAEAALVENAASTSPDLLRVQAEVWQARLDPDGAKPAEDAAHRNRGIKVGIEGPDGITRTVLLTATEETALLRAIFDANRRGVQWKRQPAEDCDDDTEWHEVTEDRTKAQYDHDTLFAIVRAGLGADPDTPSKAPEPEVVIHVDAADLANREGCGWIDGVLGRISIPSVERLECAGRTRLVVTGKDGEPLHLGRKKRRFSRAQRRALAARDGGCAFPGCRAPVAWTEAHHIAWWKRDGRSD
ncbi:MAG TPA: DUF222 domain-containing protein, partial [Amnibacterium sp.]|uniref:DUF222 domain-containing protein n=1 Tax=Amnibacterium sp. TaxID=1872496 RepID=UPI002F953E9B